MCKAPKELLSYAPGLSELLNNDHYRNYRIQCRLCVITQSVAVAHCDMFTCGFFVSPFVPIVRRYRKFGCTVIDMLDLFLFRTHARLDFFAVCVCYYVYKEPDATYTTCLFVSMDATFVEVHRTGPGSLSHFNELITFSVY